MDELMDFFSRFYGCNNHHSPKVNMIAHKVVAFVIVRQQAGRFTPPSSKAQQSRNSQGSFQKYGNSDWLHELWLAVFPGLCEMTS